MNILYVTQEYPPDTGGGGVGSYTYQIAHAFAAHGHTVHVLSSVAPDRAPGQAMQDAVCVHRARRWKFQVPLLRRAVLKFFPRTKHQLEYAYGLAREIERVVRTYAIDLVEAPELWAEGVFYLRRRTVPVVVKSHGPLFMLRALNHYRSTLDWHIVDAVDRYWYLHADCRTSPSTALAQRIAMQYKTQPSEIDIVPSCIDTTQFAPRALPDNTTRRILFVGRLEPLKGIYTLVHAMPQVIRAIPNVEFVFAGADTAPNGNSCRAEMQKHLQANGMTAHAKFLGAVPLAQIRDEIWASDVCVLPSTYENYPTFILEAMACARPVIASAVGGIPEMMQDGVSGVLIPPQAPAALSGALIRVLDDSTFRRQIALAARARVEIQNAPRVVVGKQLEIYETTVELWQQRRMNSQGRAQ